MKAGAATKLIVATALPTIILMTIPSGVPDSISVASIGIPDTFFLMLLALIVFGPRRLPEIGRQIGKLMYEFRKVSNDFKFQMEEELRNSEEAERVRKMEALQAATPAQPALTDSAMAQPAIDVARLDVSPQPVLESAESANPLAITDGAVSAGSHFVEESAPSVEGEVRAEAPGAPAILPPTSGETIAAQKPFRHRVPEVAPEPVTESGSPAIHEPAEPLLVSDEGRIGTEVQPGIEVSPRAQAAGAEQEVHHG
jgi:sec-independent protein translocase protein TatB